MAAADPPGWLPPEPPGTQPGVPVPPPPPGPAPAPGPEAALGGATQAPQWPPPQAAGPVGGFYPPAQVGPDNTPAVVGFVLALSSIGLLLLFGGFSAPLTVVVGVVALVYARKGRRRVKTGETTVHAGLADAGFWMSIATIVLSLLAAAGWIIFFLTVDDLDFDNLDENQNDPDGVRSALGVAALIARAAAGLA